MRDAKADVWSVRCAIGREPFGAPTTSKWCAVPESEGPPGGFWGAELPQGTGGDRRQKVAACAGAFPPMADGPFVDAHGSGDLALSLAFLVELPSLQPSGFFPISEWTA
jgi:hypothetical protein